MKLLDRKEFLQIENPVVFMEYTHLGNFGNLKIRNDVIINSTGKAIDFYYEDLCSSLIILNNKEIICSEDFLDIWDNIIKNRLNFRLDFNCEERDGLFEENAQYIVFDNIDIKQIIDKLYSVIKGDINE